MAKARKCDRCGDLYESYNLWNKREEPNGLMPVNLGDDNKYWQNLITDLCPICMREFKEWFEMKGRNILGKELNPSEPEVETETVHSEE